MKLKKNIYRLFAVILFTTFCISFSSAQSIEGDWYGKASIQGIELRLSLHVKQEAEGYSSTWDSPDQGAMGIASTTTTFAFPDFSFTHAQAGFKYTGKVNSGYTEITGVLLQGGQKLDIVFGRTPIAAVPGSMADLQRKFDKKEVYITMRDGVKLFTSIYTPKNKQTTYPMLLNRTPYDIEQGGPDNFNFFMQVYARYANDNYIMVFQDVRGKYMSEGTYEDIRPVIPVKKSNNDIDESTDTWDTVDWLVKNVDGNNGNVGIFGISYPGFYSTMGLIGAHPAVKAVSPQAPVTAWFIGDDFHHNGAFFILDCFSFYYSNGRTFEKPTRRGFPQFKYPTPDNYDFFLSMGAVKNFATKYLGDSIKFWNDAFAHPNYDSFWKARDPRQYLNNVKPAVLTVGGWFDAEDLYGALHTYQAIEKQNSPEVKNSIVMGPWSHGEWAFGEAKKLGNVTWGLDANQKFFELEKGFFDYYLKGEGAGNVPEATIFVTGANEWRTFETWPPKNTVQKKLYFQPAGAIKYSSSNSKSSFDEYVSDPMKPVPYTEDVHTNRTTEYMTDDQRFAARRPDVMAYQTEALDEDVTLTGPLTADLFVSTTGTDADYVVKLIDVYPADTKNPEDEEIKVPLGGYQMLVRGEVFRGKYRNSFEKPEAFVPGKVTEVKYELPDVAHTFKKGHRIMIQIQNSWFPLVDRNPQKFVDIYKCSESDFQKATQRIYHDSKYPSHLVINVLQ
jgi:uncharacterized protein